MLQRDISSCKPGRDIVARYGYFSEGKKTYQNTVQCTPPNSQMLFLNIDQIKALLELQAKKSHIEDVGMAAYEIAQSLVDKAPRNILDRGGECHQRWKRIFSLQGN